MLFPHCNIRLPSFMLPLSSCHPDSNSSIHSWCRTPNHSPNFHLLNWITSPVHYFIRSSNMIISFVNKFFKCPLRRQLVLNIHFKLVLFCKIFPCWKSGSVTFIRGGQSYYQVQQNLYAYHSICKEWFSKCVLIKCMSLKIIISSY